MGTMEDKFFNKAPKVYSAQSEPSESKFNVGRVILILAIIGVVIGVRVYLTEQQNERDNQKNKRDYEEISRQVERVTK